MDRVGFTAIDNRNERCSGGNHVSRTSLRSFRHPFDRRDIDRRADAVESSVFPGAGFRFAAPDLWHWIG
jgi:hypothetical protein